MIQTTGLILHSTVYCVSLQWSATILKGKTGQANNTYHTVTIKCSAEKPWVLRGIQADAACCAPAKDVFFSRWGWLDYNVSFLVILKVADNCWQIQVVE